MTRRRVIVSRSLIERLAFAHPGAEVVLTGDAAYLDLDGVEYVATLPPRDVDAYHAAMQAARAELDEVRGEGAS